MPASRQQVLDVLRQPGTGAARLKALEALIRTEKPRAKALWAAFDADPSLFEEPWLDRMEPSGGDPATLLRLWQAFAARFPDGAAPGWGGEDPAPFWRPGGFPGASDALLRLLQSIGWRYRDLSPLAAGLPTLPELHQDGAWFALIALQPNTRYPLPPRLLAKAAHWAVREGAQPGLGRNVRSAWPRPEWDAAFRRAIREGDDPIASYESYGETLAGATADQAVSMARRLSGAKGAFQDRWGYPLSRALKQAYRDDRAGTRALAKATMAAAAAGEGSATLLWTALGLTRLARLQAPPAADAAIGAFLAAWQPEDEDTREWVAATLRETVPPDRLKGLLSPALSASQLRW